MNRSAWEIEQQILSICYHMDSINWGDARSMSSLDRDRTIKYINKKIEQQNEAMKGV